MSVDRYGITVPQELRAVPAQSLEEYVKARLLQFVAEPVFAKRMYQTPEGVHRAAKEVLTELSIPAGKSLPDGASGTYTLLFRHECRSIGCLCPDCELCKQAQHRRCTSCFGSKYLSGDALKAKCGAPIMVEIINPRTGDVVSTDMISDIQLEVCVMDSRAYASLTPGMETAEELDACTLLVNSQGKELLSPGKNSTYNEEHKIVTPMHNNVAELQVHVAGSSIAMLQGQRPPFRLLVRATGVRDGRRVEYVKPVVSDAFVVATQRVKTAQKAEIPHIDEPVSKIENVGVQTQNKLQDIKAAAEQIGVHGLSVVHNCITTVGQFKELVESSETDQPLQETLKKVLNFTSNGWHKAREHAMRAVSTDNRMRAWCADDSLEDGLLFKCYLGRVDLEAPEAARKAWWQPGHPGWCIPWDYDSTAFMRSLTEAPNVAQPAPSPKMRISAPVPRNLQNNGLPSLGNPLALGLQPSLPPNSPHDRGYRPPAAGPGGSASNNALAQISAAQLLPNFCQSLYASNPGAMLGSGQAAGMALGSSSHTGMTSGLNTSSSPLAMGAARYLAGLGMGSGGSGGGAGAKLPDSEAYASATGFDFGAPARSRAPDGLMPLVRGTSLSRGFALPVQGPGGFKVGHLPTSPFEGVRNHSGPGTSASNSSGAPANGGPFGSRMVRTTTSMDTTNSNSGHHSANQSDQMGGLRGLTSSASQKERDRSPKGRESPFETMKHQQQRDQKPRLGSMQRPQHPQSQGGPLGGQGPSRLQPQGSNRPQPQPHNPFAGLQPQGGDRQPQGSDRQQQQPGLSNFQQHQIQQAYNNLMQHKQHLPSDEANPHHMSDSSYPVQPVPSRAGPNNMLSLPSYRILPSLTSNDLDTIMKLRQQLSGENGLLTRLSSFMQARRSTDQRTMAGHDSSESLRAPASAVTTALDAEGSGQGQSLPALEDVKEQAQLARAVQEDVAKAKDSLREGQAAMAATGHDGKPMLGRFSSKVGSLLDELADVLGAFDGIPVAQEDEAAGSQQPTPLMQNRFSGQEINENGLNGVHKSAFEPVTSSQNKRRKLAAHPSSESDNNSQPHASAAAGYREDQQQ
ncbi:MAG: nitrogen regulatory P-II [Trebouxia sp. A1-2]|nr:MAG: nitrogen regulatory P-II [Trebouxia sp. A1-2]